MNWINALGVYIFLSFAIFLFTSIAIDSYGVLGFCPTSISAAHRDSNGACKDPERLCRECRKEFWSQEVE